LMIDFFTSKTYTPPTIWIYHTRNTCFPEEGLLLYGAIWLMLLPVFSLGS
jgi:hypothetical protein